VNLTLSRRGDYVVRSALALARAYESGAPRKIREVVAEMDIPQTFASQILADLVHAELATSKAGKAGGYRLARPPDQVTVLEIVEAGEGPLRSERCALSDGPCRWDHVCPLHETWGAAAVALRSTLAGTTLADLVARDRALEEGSYALPADSHRHGSAMVDVEDWVQVELGLAEVRDQLRRVETWLPRCVRAGYAEAEQLRLSIDPMGPPWAAPARSSIAVLAPNSAPDGRTEIVWECGDTRQPASRFEGHLEVSTLDPERSEIHLDGRLRPPGRGVGSDVSLVERLSRATVRGSLRQAAKVLEAARPLLPARRV
jgi:Rrf2 family protein